MERQKTFKIGERQFVAKFPNVGQIIDLESFKQALTNNRYGQMAMSGIASMYFALDLVDAIAFYSVIVPEVGKYFDISNFAAIPLDKAKEEYIALPLDEKQYISSLSSAPAVRAYILVSGLIDQSINETKDAMDKADSAIKSSGEDKRLIEERLMKLVVQKVIKIHPDWDFSEYSDVFSVDTKKPGEAEIEHGEISSTSEGDETPEKDK